MYTRKIRQNGWTKYEDDMFIRLVKDYTGKDSPDIRDIDFGYISSHMHKRSSRQCIERWKYALRPGLDRSSLTDNEKKLINEMVSSIGNNWGEIAKKMPTRSTLQIKNYRHSAERQRKRVLKRKRDEEDYESKRKKMCLERLKPMVSDPYKPQKDTISLDTKVLSPSHKDRESLEEERKPFGSSDGDRKSFRSPPSVFMSQPSLPSFSLLTSMIQPYLPMGNTLYPFVYLPSGISPLDVNLCTTYGIFPPQPNLHIIFDGASSFCPTFI